MSEDEECSEIIVGTYDDYVRGYRVETVTKSSKKKLKKSSKDDNKSSEDSNLERKYFLEQSFGVRGHSGSVKCLAASEDGSLTLSAGSDEMMNLFGLAKNKLLQTSEGAINCASFVGNTHLICGFEEGDILIYEFKRSSMSVVKTLKGHKTAVISLSVHPSGKILLSLSKDNTMRTWNLIKGRLAYTTFIKTQAHLVAWSKSGEEFLVAANNEVYLYNKSGILEHNIKLEKRVNSIEFITDEIFVAASDTKDIGRLEFFDLKKGVSLMKFDAHKSRIKCIKCCGKALFATASSDGQIKLWSITNEPEFKEPQELAEVSTGDRITCMTTAIHSVIR